jgi:methionyl-tRNA synthetase
MPEQRYYLTTPIYYVNDAPHIGHAYTTLACDVLARFKRLEGSEVKFLTGTDEHGQKVEKSAAKAGLDPKAFTDQVSQNFRDLARVMGFSQDDFIRTTEERHIRSCQALWRRLKANGEIYLGSYAGWYAVRDEAFYGEDELAKGPDGKLRAPSGAEVEWVEEPSYFFRLSQWQEKLLAFYEENPGFIAPESRRNEVISFVKSGLKDLSVSRTSFRWGVPVPEDPDHIMYVWLDALTNYITAVGFPDLESFEWKRFWPADLHMVGKDIVRFHAVYWPAFLMAADLPPPRRVFAHGWWTNEGQKISKSLGNVIDPVALVERYGLDAVRYFLLREVPFGNDGDFSHKAMIGRLNSELANGFGNLAQRTLSFIAKNGGAKVPTPGTFTERDRELLLVSSARLVLIRHAMEEQSFHVALQRWFDIVDLANKYIDEQAPWALRKSDPGRMATVLYVLVEALRHIAILAMPFMPGSAGKLLDQLGVAGDPAARGFAAIGLPPGEVLSPAALTPGAALPPPQGIFPRFVESGEGATEGRG